MLNIKKQRGLTLIELMIGLLVGAIITGAAFRIFSGSVKSGNENIQTARLHQNIQTVMDMMVRDIRRAGYVTSDPVAYRNCIVSNPFYIDAGTIANYAAGGVANQTLTAAVNACPASQAIVLANTVTDLVVGNFNGSPCIVYTYNRNEQAERNANQSPVVDTNEFAGFRLNNGAVEMKVSGAINDNNCNDGTWRSITDPDITITQMDFQPQVQPLSITRMNNGVGDPNNNGICDPGEGCNSCNAGEQCLFSMQIQASLIGQLTQDPSVTSRSDQSISIRNDKFIVFR